jgi:hypothetical protein
LRGDDRHQVVGEPFEIGRHRGRRDDATLAVIPRLGGTGGPLQGEVQAAQRGGLHDSVGVAAFDLADGGDRQAGGVADVVLGQAQLGAALPCGAA